MARRRDRWQKRRLLGLLLDNVTFFPFRFEEVAFQCIAVWCIRSSSSSIKPISDRARRGNEIDHFLGSHLGDDRSDGGVLRVLPQNLELAALFRHRRSLADLACFLRAVLTRAS